MVSSETTKIDGKELSLEGGYDVVSACAYPENLLGGGGGGVGAASDSRVGLAQTGEEGGGKLSIKLPLTEKSRGFGPPIPPHPIWIRARSDCQLRFIAYRFKVC